MSHHLNAAGELQSDKHPELPPDCIRLNLKNPTSERALRVLAADYRGVDSQFAEDLVARLDAIHGSASRRFEGDEILAARASSAGILRQELRAALGALTSAGEMLRLRDRMNAKIHLGEPRLSPITVKVETARERLEALDAETGVPLGGW